MVQDFVQNSLQCQSLHYLCHNSPKSIAKYLARYHFYAVGEADNQISGRKLPQCSATRYAPTETIKPQKNKPVLYEAYFTSTFQRTNYHGGDAINKMSSWVHWFPTAKLQAIQCPLTQQLAQEHSSSLSLRQPDSVPKRPTG